MEVEKKEKRIQERNEERTVEREREEGGEEGKVYSSDRRSTIRVALRTTIVGSTMTGLLLIPGEK